MGATDTGGEVIVDDITTVQSQVDDITADQSQVNDIIAVPIKVG